MFFFIIITDLFRFVGAFCVSFCIVSTFYVFRKYSCMATFWERAAHFVNQMFSLYCQRKSLKSERGRQWSSSSSVLWDGDWDESVCAGGKDNSFSSRLFLQFSSVLWWYVLLFISIWITNLKSCAVVLKRCCYSVGCLPCFESGYKHVAGRWSPRVLRFPTPRKFTMDNSHVFKKAFISSISSPKDCS